MDAVKLILVICLSVICIQCQVDAISSSNAGNPCETVQCNGEKVCEVHQGKPMCVPVRNNPEVCKEPMKSGPCDKSSTRFYYNAETHSCTSFTWGGCEPNGNNFKSFVQCVRTCGQFKG